MSPLYRSLFVLAAFLGVLVFAESASAQQGGIKLYKLDDGGVKDFGQNLGNDDVKYTIHNAGQTNIKVVWFDKQTNEWKEKELTKHERWSVTIQFGEYLRVEDVNDHAPSQFGVLKK